MLAYELTGGRQMGPRHAREQVMLDLIVQARPSRRSPPAAGDVARHQHLLARGSRTSRRRGTIGMPTWFGAKCANVQAEDRELDAEEGCGHAERQQPEEEPEIDPEAHGEHVSSRQRPWTFDRSESPDGRHMQVEAFEQQQREEQIALKPGEPRPQPFCVAAVLSRNEIVSISMSGSLPILFGLA